MCKVSVDTLHITFTLGTTVIDTTTTFIRSWAITHNHS